mgnify:CR=1 FL=1
MEPYVDTGFCASYLRQGEQILWKCRPERGHLFRKGDWRRLLLLALSAAYLTLELCDLIDSAFVRYLDPGLGAMLRFLGINCCLLCVAYGFYRLVYRPFVRRRTCYVITNRQVLCKGLFRVKTMDLKDPLPLYSHFFRDGNGTIAFGMSSLIPLVHWNGAQSMIPIFSHFELDNIPRAEQVLDLICGVIRDLNEEEEHS